MKKVFKIVCEGNTDMALFKELVPEFGRIANKVYKVEELFPPSKAANAGWPNLKLWCMKQAALLQGSINAQREAAAAILGVPPGVQVKKRAVDLISAACQTKQGDAETKVIIVQLDSDIAHDLLADVGRSKDDFLFPMHPTERLKVCEDALDSWLGPHAAKKGVNIFYCINLVSIENWVLTLHGHHELKVPDGYDYDLVHAPDVLLVELGYPAKKNKEGVMVLKKDPPKYKVHGQKMSSQLSLCCARSQTLRNFGEVLEYA
ncbi:hypothetical protein H7683_21725 [Ectopseudomonas mendocina]|uniref:hypothetical protein n=1 Tax=Ectopseudomonas mendocina TaxID=300 RepID=UPI001ADED47C|nr:hypothetical protein [Pseudomonas mendocina]QTN45562.1 hypothetical protein H7683_21725 [Pseudomonas mendocina]